MNFSGLQFTEYCLPHGMLVCAITKAFLLKPPSKDKKLNNNGYWGRGGHWKVGGWEKDIHLSGLSDVSVSSPTSLETALHPRSISLFQ